MPLKLGKHPPRHDYRTLKLGKYLKLDGLPPLPTFTDWTPKVLAAGLYGMLANDAVGDCAIAGPLHIVQTWNANANTPVQPTDADALSAYHDVAGYDPSQTDSDGNNPTDTGCNLLDVLKYWRNIGMPIGITRHKIYAFLQISGITQLRYAVWLFGSALIGVALPDSVCQGDLLANPWDDTVTDAPDDQNGHCIVAATQQSGSLPVETWGAIKPMSAGFATRYIDEGYAIISMEWFNAASKTSPSGFDFATLQTDLADLGNQPAPPPDPAPAPEPPAPSSESYPEPAPEPAPEPTPCSESTPTPSPSAGVQLHIVSDGTVLGTQVLTQDGTPLEHVTAIRWSIDAQEGEAVVHITLANVPVDVVGESK